MKKLYPDDINDLIEENLDPDTFYKGGVGSGKRGHQTAKKQTSAKPSGRKTSEDILAIANHVESKGAGFFQRNGDDMTIWIRDPGPTGAMWGNARSISNMLGSRSGEIVPDPQSGHLYIKVKDAYKK